MKFKFQCITPWCMFLTPSSLSCTIIPQEYNQGIQVKPYDFIVSGVPVCCFHCFWILCNFCLMQLVKPFGVYLSFLCCLAYVFISFSIFLFQFPIFFIHLPLYTAPSFLLSLCLTKALFDTSGVICLTVYPY